MELLNRGALRHVSVLSAVSNLPDHIRERQGRRADELLRKQGIKPHVELAAPPSLGKGTCVFVLAEYAHARGGFTSYGRMRKPAEQVAKEACRAFVRYHKQRQPVDRHLADQLLLPLALADGATTFAVSIVTGHLLTNAWVIQQFVDRRIDIEGTEGEPGIVRIYPAA
jgi:RNA 3'-terminal phosphate cyclase (ATP)